MTAHGNNREMQVLRGTQTEVEIVERLNLYGIAYRAQGRNGYPDIVFDNGTTKLGIESKRMAALSFKKSTSNVPIYKKEWEDLKYWCENNEAIPVLIVQVVVRNRLPLVYVLTPDVVDSKLMASNGEVWFGFSQWQIFENGLFLDDFFSLLYVTDNVKNLNNIKDSMKRDSY